MHVCPIELTAGQDLILKTRKRNKTTGPILPRMHA